MDDGHRRRRAPAAATAYLFPSFPMREAGLEHAQLPGFAEIVGELAARAAAVADVTPRTFAPVPGGGALGLEATLQAQYACFIESLAFARWIEGQCPPADYLAGYSMGLFAAACHAGALGFEDGLEVVHRVCVAGHAGVAGAYAVGAVFGIDPGVLDRVIARVGRGVEVIDVYGPRSLLVIGPEPAVAAVLALCARRGADTTLIPVTAPFHASALRGVARDISLLLRTVPVKEPRRPLLSCGTLRLLRTTDAVRREIARNICHGMNWHGTMQTLLGLGVTFFVECGPSQRLTRMARREVPGEYAFRNFTDLAPAGSVQP